ncbi:MAG: helix-hairpin-helix domain-containing protein [Pirellulaceae bacterium]|nr:helix-hairpin-helix domain-containing protein [Pirellulaceae bacterium]
MIDEIAIIARDLKLSNDSVNAAVRLLDEGNAIPFVARFRKDQTNGLDADQLSAIKQRAAELRALAERKAFVLKSIESQGKLTEALAKDIEAASNSRRLEDLYLPYKPKKQSLATTARQQGLEPIADEIFEGSRPDVDLPSRATEFVRVDKGLNSVDDVIAGVRHLIAERMSEQSDLRRELRKIIWNSSELTCKLVQSENSTDPNATEETATEQNSKTGESANAATNSDLEGASVTPPPSMAEIETNPEQVPANDTETESVASGEHPSLVAESSENRDSNLASGLTQTSSISSDPLPHAESALGMEHEPVLQIVTDSPLELNAELSETTPTSPPPSKADEASQKAKRRKPKKKKTPPHPFKDYDNFAESIKRIPNHRVLAINRGERSGQLKIKVRVDQEALDKRALELLVPSEHPFKPFLEECALDALHRMVLPSLEREVRRELTDSAERHAVQVFAHNLKALLLRPPVRGKRVLSIDPGYKNGCSIAILDAQGNPIHSDRVFIVGNEQRRIESRAKLSKLIRDHQVDLVVIGNGTACREAEILVSDAIREDIADLDIKYVIANEAGASTYSTSEIGKEELPDLLPHARSAVSIGRRIQDPLSELVKISPGHLGVGLYQHDIKAKHLAESLDDVVESCVNFVGVNSNTASTALLKYVAGLNQLTAKRLLEQRTAKPITNRQELREVAGIGEATFVQSAGFLRVYEGTNPLDETAIHPESYHIAEQILKKIGLSVDDWMAGQLLDAQAQDKNESQAAETLHKLTELNAATLAQEFQVGELMLRDILKSLERPRHDPRQKFSGPVFRSGIIKLEDLEPQMELQSQVVNVVDFGVFVDVGLGSSCLVHVSELSAGYIQDLHQQFAVGDALLTWVKEIDVARRRVKLTAIKPGTPKVERQPRGHGNRRRKPTSGAKPEATASVATAENKTQRGGKPRTDRNQAAKPERKPGRFERSNQFRGSGGGGKGNKRNRDEGRTYAAKPTKPKPIAPLNDDVLAGKKPMRSFSDLAQFYTQQKPTPESDQE